MSLINERHCSRFTPAREEVYRNAPFETAEENGFSVQTGHRPNWNRGSLSWGWQPLWPPAHTHSSVAFHSHLQSSPRGLQVEAAAAGSGDTHAGLRAGPRRPWIPTLRAFCGEVGRQVGGVVPLTQLSLRPWKFLKYAPENGGQRWGRVTGLPFKQHRAKHRSPFHMFYGSMKAHGSREEEQVEARFALSRSPCYTREHGMRTIPGSRCPRGGLQLTKRIL